jgi:hypothetical protein
MLDFGRLSEVVDIDAAQNAADAQLMAEAEKIDASEAEWLIARLQRDGKISAAEKRLLAFLKAESPSIAPALAALMEKAVRRRGRLGRGALARGGGGLITAPTSAHSPSPI